MTGARMTMPDAIPPPGTPADVYPDLKPARARLIELIDRHLPTVKAFMAASDGLYSIDLFMVGVANRSFYLATGFIDALDQWNIYAAAPLVRLQTDSLLRVNYTVRAPRADHVVDAVIRG